MIGGLLLGYGNDVKKWRSVLDSEVWNIDVAKCKILPSLWLSYYHLPEDIKQCFAYISLFPKDYEFKMEEMIMLWVAESFIERTLTIEQQEDVARGYFDHLLLNFFIQESSSSSSQFVLHDIVHDLAEYVSRGLCVNWADINLQSRRLSYIQREDEILLYNLKVQKLTRLRTFLPMRRYSYYHYLDDKILSDMLSNFKFLRVLSLEGYNISVLPDSVGDMKLLRYMNISRTYIESLPLRICRLYNLQYLILRSCYGLKRLPANIVDLVNLRYLDVRNTSLLKEMPDGIGTMKKLQVLYISDLLVGKDKSKQLKELKDLTNLHGKLQISGLNNITDKEHVVAAQFGSKEYLEELVLEWGWRRINERDTTLDERVLDAIQAHENLKKLTIKGYAGKRLSTWIVGMTPSSNIKLRSLWIDQCFNLETLPPLGNLPALVKLTITGSRCIQSLGEEFYGGSSNPFPALEKFEIRDMYALKTWSLPGRNRRGFPSLKELEIQNCPELMTFPICFPSLTDLQIVGCYKLCGLEMCGGASLGSLPALKNLSMKGVHRPEAFNEEFYGVDCSNASFFPALERFEIKDMRGLKTWCFPGGRGFASLKELRIENCHELVIIPFCFPCLTKLSIWNCDNLIEIEMIGGPKEGSVSTTYGHSLLSIFIFNCPKLEEIPKSFVNLLDVECSECNKLASLPRLQHVRKLNLLIVNESMSLRAAIQDNTYLEELSVWMGYGNVGVELLSLDPNHLASLKRLKITFTEDDDCKRIFWENDDNVAKRAPPNLSHLLIFDWSLQMSAKVLIHFSSGAIITNLVFARCFALESFPPDVELPSTLQSLEITNFCALKTISDGFLSGCSNSLRELRIINCHNLVCLPRSLSTFQSIQELYLSSCTALESLPDEFHRAPALRTLSLKYCPKLGLFKECCGFPTALTHLTIMDCLQMKAVSNLRLTKLTSLADLKLKGFTETLRLEAGSLPESIEELTIWDFPLLESLSGLLPTLKNLRQLDVHRCPLVNQKPRSRIKKLIPQQCI